MNLLVNEPPRRPGQPLCQDPWGLEAALYGHGHDASQSAGTVRPRSPLWRPWTPTDTRSRSPS